MADFVKVDRPDWTQYFFGIAFVVSQRSEDPNTRHGCVLTDRHYHIIGTGYNSLPRKISDGLISNIRPLKNLRMIHAEENTLLNTTLDPWLIPDGAIAYITGKPCLRCLDRLWNKNVTELYCADTGYHFQNYEQEQEDFNKFVEDTGIKVYSVKPDLEWIKRIKTDYRA